MKNKIIFVISLISLAVNIKAQKIIEAVFEKYADDERFTYVSVGRGAVNMVKSLVDLDEMTSKEKSIIENVTGLKILTLESKTENEEKLAKNIVSDIYRVVKTDQYDVVAEVREKGERVTIYTAKNNKEMLLITNKANEMSLIWIK
jgi:hypothetical protein